MHRNKDVSKAIKSQSGRSLVPSKFSFSCFLFLLYPRGKGLGHREIFFVTCQSWGGQISSFYGAVDAKLIYRQDREFSKEPSCLLSNRSLKEPFGKEFRIKSQHTKGIPLPSPPVRPETVSTQGTVVILSNLMHPLNVFKDLNSGQTRFIVSHRKKKSIPAFMKQSWRLLSVIILTCLGCQQKGCERGSQGARHTQVQVWTPQQRVVRSYLHIGHMYNASQATP